MIFFLLFLLLSTQVFANEPEYLEPEETEGPEELQMSLKIPGLGRPFRLGALYDVRTDRLVAPGVSLWDSEFLNEHISERPKPYSKVEVFDGSSFSKRSDFFQLSGEMKASFAAGLIKVSGSGK